MWEIAPRFSDLLTNTGIQFLRDRVKTLLPCDGLGVNGSQSSVTGGTVLLESGFNIEYDWYHVLHNPDQILNCVYVSGLIIFLFLQPGWFLLLALNLSSILFLEQWSLLYRFTLLTMLL